MNRWVATTFGVLTTVLLIGQRFGVEWAGGTGFVRRAEVLIIDEVGTAKIDRAGTTRDSKTGEAIQRGETVVTGADTFIHFRLSQNTEVYLSQNSRVTVSDLTPGSMELYLLAGRMYVRVNDKELAPTVRTGWTYTKPSIGETAFVYYDFQDTIVVAPLTAQPTAIALRASGEGFITTKPVSIHEVMPVTTLDTAFSPYAGDAEAFYTWSR
jgi:ferric-dicitrate binding protein FerR (iron transport regulator)